MEYPGSCIQGFRLGCSCFAHVSSICKLLSTAAELRRDPKERRDVLSYADHVT